MRNVRVTDISREFVLGDWIVTIYKADQCVLTHKKWHNGACSGDMGWGTCKWNVATTVISNDNTGAWIIVDCYRNWLCGSEGFAMPLLDPGKLG